MARNDDQPEVTGWVGWVYFAGFLMLLSGLFQSIMGLTALVNNSFYTVVNGTLVAFDVTTWGWLHLIYGIIVLCAGVALFGGSLWARIVAILLAVFGVVGQFAFVAAYPIWSIIAITIGIFIIYALTVHGGEARVE